MLQPIIVLIIWTLIMLIWLYAKRIPAMQKAKVKPDDYKISVQKKDNPLSLDAVAVADNYNHLHESPTLFYAMALTIHVAGINNAVLTTLAWVYVAFRIIHSLIQANQGKVIVRFTFFILSALVLILMAVKTAIELF